MSEQTLARTPFFLRFSPLNPNFSGNPGELLNAFAELSEIVGPEGLYVIIVSDIEPSSNQGLWLKDGLKPYVWDDDTGHYIPMILTDSLTEVLAAIAALQANEEKGRLIFSETAPTGDDAAANVLWCRIDSAGYLVAFYNFTAGEWHLRQTLPVVIYGPTNGTGNAVNVVPAPAETAYVAGRIYLWQMPDTNTGPVTVNVSGIGSVAVVLGPSTPLSAGQLVGDQWVLAIYDGARMQVLSNLHPTPDDAGPIAATATVESTGTLPVVATARTDIDEHGLSGAPEFVEARFVAIADSAATGWAAGEWVPLWSVLGVSDDVYTPMYAVNADATKVYYTTLQTVTTAVVVPDKDTGGLTRIDDTEMSNWKIVVNLAKFS